jgi:hypothetical protein
MLPHLAGFLAGIRLFTRRRHPKPIAFDEQALADALTHAKQLAAGNEQDEPAALFFACARRSRAFGAASHDLLPIVARNVARGLGFRLDIDDIELAILHSRIALGVIAFEDLRRTFAAALLPVAQSEQRPPPKRSG